MAVRVRPARNTEGNIGGGDGGGGDGGGGEGGGGEGGGGGGEGGGAAWLVSALEACLKP